MVGAVDVPPTGFLCAHSVLIQSWTASIVAVLFVVSGALIPVKSVVETKLSHDDGKDMSSTVMNVDSLRVVSPVIVVGIGIRSAECVP